MTEESTDSNFTPSQDARFYSHPHSPNDDSTPRLLSDHLNSVSGRAVWSLNGESGTPHTNQSLPQKDRAHAAYISAWAHDLGKANPFFQRKLDISNAASAPSAPPVPELTYHSRLGGFLAYYCLSKAGATTRNQVAAYLAVAKHHGRLPDAAQYIAETARADDRARECLIGTRKPTRTREELLQDGWCWAATALINDADSPSFAHARAYINSVVNYLTAGKGSFDEFAEQMQSGALQSSIRTRASRTGMVQPAPESLPDALYDRTIALWSSLTLADKTDVMGITERLQATHLPLSKVSTQIDSLGGNETTETEAQLNELRDTARKEVVESGVESLVKADTGVGEITLPTGLGKTLTGIEAAFKIRNHKRESGNVSRVIYALPYTSIIEQTRDLLESKPGSDSLGFGLSPFSKQYTIHHHLSDTVTTQSGEEPTEVADRSAVAIAEAWRSGLTLTTFAQLFESLTGPRNGQSMKLPALENSVIILDEPQTIPYRWWRGTVRLLRLLVEEFNATVLLMTATQPRLPELDEDLPSIELVSNPSEYLTRAERVQYKLAPSVTAYANGQDSPISHSTAGQQLLEQVTTDDVASTLAVCNTVTSARRLRSAIIDQASNTDIPITDIGGLLENVWAETDIHELSTSDVATRLLEKAQTTLQEHPETLLLGHLTARHRPIDRRIILDVVDELTTSEQPFVFVTTQLVEAGVDLSFQSVYRDLAPLESIIQAAGRCNRSFEWGITGGTVTVWQLADSTSGEGRLTPGEKVYARGAKRTLLRAVAELLVDNAENRSLEERALDTTTINQYFSSIQDAGHSDEQILTNIQQAQAAKLAETEYIESADSRDVIVPTSTEQRDTLASLGKKDTQGALDALDSYTDYRISIPDSGIPDSTLTGATTRITDGLDILLLKDLENYTARTGLEFT
jgi:CRISPR-associated endonuclease/helicase Cas3